MAKRRRKKPNISQTALEQARQEANDEATPNSPQAGQATSPKTEAVAKASQPKSRRRRRDLQAAQLDKRKNAGELDAEYVANLLANPTKIVTEEELHQDYGYVIQDLRNMGILATALFVALIGMALVIL